MTEEELDAILSDRFSEWIKVEKYTPTNYWDDFWNLDKHHIEETTFLIEKCKELALELKNAKEMYDRVQTFTRSMRSLWIQQGRDELEREQRGY